jgi:hypothetical protein
MEPTTSSEGIFITNLPLTTTEYQIFEQYKDYGRIETIELFHPKGQSKVLSAKIRFEENQKNEAKDKEVTNSNFRSENEESTTVNPHIQKLLKLYTFQQIKQRSVFLWNLPLSMSNSQLWQLYSSEYGEILDAYRLVTQEGKPLTCGYIHFKRLNSAKLCLRRKKTKAKNGIEIKAKQFELRKKKNQKKSLRNPRYDQREGRFPMNRRKRVRKSFIQSDEKLEQFPLENRDRLRVGITRHRSNYGVSFGGTRNKDQFVTNWRRARSDEFPSSHPEWLTPFAIDYNRNREVMLNHSNNNNNFFRMDPDFSKKSYPQDMEADHPPLQSHKNLDMVRTSKRRDDNFRNMKRIVKFHSVKPTKSVYHRLCPFRLSHFNVKSKELMNNLRANYSKIAMSQV